ncbi:hypothetical protein GWO43_06860 [candidate division KSB1 bacterium]|nr:hypothetical protein [candidate division KSB1 bacterium]NIR72655.1 hypothetical protein [candidate division KSB1 bacterium]NIS23685.1 hypothetical protein [candidate division KSB1 bacterium]NIT70605.1 hypothetical protein [candidate division KSB1 bacterium]NIU24333.1 hypothetical protein [candidate division KSB1 bacterium]
MKLHKLHFILLPFFLLLFATINLAADQANEEKQKALQKEVEHSLVAPCCWNMTVDQHDSQASRAVRQQIEEFIKEGRTKEEMLEYFSQQYGERILASPSQETLLGKSAYWLIPIAFAFGVLVVGIAIRRMAKTSTDKQPAQKPQEPQISKKDPDLDKRVENELSQFD